MDAHGHPCYLRSGLSICPEAIPNPTYEFQWPDVLLGFRQAKSRGAQVSIVYDDIDKAPGRTRPMKRRSMMPRSNC